MCSGFLDFRKGTVVHLQVTGVDKWQHLHRLFGWTVDKESEDCAVSTSAISSALAPNLYFFFQALPGSQNSAGPGRKVHFLVILLDLFPIKYFPQSEGF